MYAFSMKTVQRFDGCVWMRPQVVFQGLLVCSVIVINDGKKKKRNRLSSFKGQNSLVFESRSNVICVYLDRFSSESPK